MACECGPPSWVLLDLDGLTRRRGAAEVRYLPATPRLRVNHSKRALLHNLGGPHSRAMTILFASHDQYAVAEKVETILLPHDLAIGGEREVLAGKGGDEHQMARARLVQVGQHRIDRLVAVSRADIEVGPALARAERLAALRHRFERASGRRSHGDEATAAPARRVERARGCVIHPEPFRADLMVLDVARRDMAIGFRKPDMKGDGHDIDALGAQPGEDRLREMQPRRRHFERARLGGIDVAIALHALAQVLQRGRVAPSEALQHVVEIALELEPHDPQIVRIRTQQHRAHLAAADADPAPAPRMPRGAYLREPAVGVLAEQDERNPAVRAFAVEPVVHDEAVVDDERVGLVEPGFEIAELGVLDPFARAVEHHQPRVAAASAAQFARPGRYQPLRHPKLELRRPHAARAHRFDAQLQSRKWKLPRVDFVKTGLPSRSIATAYRPRQPVRLRPSVRCRYGRLRRDSLLSLRERRLVPEVGIEPTCPCGRWILSLPRQISSL